MSRTPITTLYRKIRDWVQGTEAHERTRELIGALLADRFAEKHQPASLHEVEFRVHSQFGDDGIIQWLVSQLPSLPRQFVEFGVEDYLESNTRFLMVNNNWRGLIMDGSMANIADVRKRDWFWRYDLTAISLFLTSENVDRTIASWANGEPVGLLHIDVDGNDYWLWQAIGCITPAIAIIEYNATLGCERPVTIPYQPEFDRLRAHSSGLYWGASLTALTHLANKKGYGLVGVNSAGNNAYFVRREWLRGAISEVSPSEAFVIPAYRESRDEDGGLSYLSYAQRQAAITGLPVVNVATGQVEAW